VHPKVDGFTGSSLICRTEPKKEKWRKLKTKSEMLRKTIQSWSPQSSPGAGRESMVGNICERGRPRFWAGSERVRELRILRVVSITSRIVSSFGRTCLNAGYASSVRYDTIRWTILTCAQKLTSSQLNLPHGTKQKKNNEETKNN